jgi:uncharacterized OsmC-like protein
LSAHAAFAPSVRVRWTSDRGVQAYARAHMFAVASQAGIDHADPAPSAIEYSLGALAGDLLLAFRREARARRIAIHGLEVSLTGRFENVLVHLGVIGEQGDAGLTVVVGTAYVNADADDDTLRDVWRTAQARAPLCATLSRAIEVAIELKIVPL